MPGEGTGTRRSFPRRAVRLAVSAATCSLVVVLAAACRRSGPDWRVTSLYGGKASIDLLTTAPNVQAFLLAPPGAAPKADEVHAGPYVARAAALDVPADVAAELRAILGDADTYDWRRAKGDAFRPQIGLRFSRAAYVLEIALDLGSSQIAAYAGDQTLGAEDVDAARARLVAVAKRLFPDDPAIGGLE